ncbi:FMN-linked oxidoreductase [Artomyces pyxidatus]|uniref:FMN-linked oxidoreductase n=1 Tax=Artomyces pyxidatus TaxID=48021 RepID=A0ACB8TED1_9AGAM|nr:FMN-linked oxidoreductase [Artomyces pyxidatus]
MTILDELRYIAAPMVDQSDTPFRALVHAHGATLSYTQMLQPARLLSDCDYLEFHRRGLEMGRTSAGPVVVQLCGNDADEIVRGAKTVVDLCDGIDLNLGCPQEAAREEHFGAYLLGQKDWPLVQQIVSSLSHSLTVPVSAKLRLCTPTASTLPLAQSLAASGASFLTLHARHASTRRRRQGAADLSVVKALVDGVDVPVVSNGNVRTWEDVHNNAEETGASGIMVGETLLENPYLFEGKMPDPVLASLEYIELCRLYPDTATLKTIQTHVRHFIAFHCQRRPWFTHFRVRLAQCSSVEEIESLLRGRVRRWRGDAGAVVEEDEDEMPVDEQREGEAEFGLDTVFS